MWRCAMREKKWPGAKAPYGAAKSFSGVGGRAYGPALAAMAAPSRAYSTCCSVMRLTTTLAWPAMIAVDASPTDPGAPLRPTGQAGAEANGRDAQHLGEAGRVEPAGV